MNPLIVELPAGSVTSTYEIQETCDLVLRQELRLTIPTAIYNLLDILYSNIQQLTGAETFIPLPSNGSCQGMQEVDILFTARQPDTVGGAMRLIDLAVGAPFAAADFIADATAVLAQA